MPQQAFLPLVILSGKLAARSCPCPIRILGGCFTAAKLPWLPPPPVPFPGPWASHWPLPTVPALPGQDKATPALPHATHKGAFPALTPVPPASCQGTSACTRRATSWPQITGSVVGSAAGTQGPAYTEASRAAGAASSREGAPCQKAASPATQQRNNFFPRGSPCRDATVNHRLPQLQRLGLRGLLGSTGGRGVSYCRHPRCGQRQGAVLRGVCLS